MANLETSLPFLTYRDELKTYLGISLADTSQDDTLERLWSSAVRYGDLWLANPFTDSAGADLPIPLGVIQGCFEWVRMAFLWYQANTSPGLGSVKTGDLSVGQSIGDGSMPVATFTNAAKPHWRPSRLKIWR